LKTLLLTGGSGTIGSAFISRYINKYKIISFSRNEKSQVSLKRKFPEVEIFLGSIEDDLELEQAFRKYKPEIVIHAAALKHVDTAEKQPSKAISVNIIGSLNIIRLSIKYGVNISIGISTDKACAPDNVYGQTKYLMERMYQEYDTQNKTRFVNCRFGNVAWSNGSVLPFWTRLQKENKILPVTSDKMTRLIFSQDEAAQLIQKCIDLTGVNKGYFILSKMMKKVNMLRLAKLISSKTKIVGLRPGEKIDEELISENEFKFSKLIDEDYIILQPGTKLNKSTHLKSSLSSENAEEMNNEEMVGLLKLVENTSESSGSTNY
jgi:UDP-N-acetylglucosamine 4,6-dehydratase